MNSKSIQPREEHWKVIKKQVLQIYKPWLEIYKSRLEEFNNMEENNSRTDIPLALRRPKRKSTVVSPTKQRAASDSVTVAKTPSTRNSKRVRFSDPGLLSASQPQSTSLTPAFRRSSLGTPSRRRPATPGPQVSGNIQFTPLTQKLDERCQRRIRRNGLSEEMNTYEADKKSKIALQKEIEAKDEELRRLREELEETKNGILQPSSSTNDFPLSSSQQRVQLVEAELEALRQSFAIEESQPIHETWDHIPRTTSSTGLGSDGGDTIMIWEDDEDIQRSSLHNTDATMMGLELEAAKQAKTNLLGSFKDAATSCNFTFADTPSRNANAVNISTTTTTPTPPDTFLHDISKQLKTTTNRAEEAELALTVLEEEIRALGFGEPDEEISIIVTTISNHFKQARLELERAVPGETVSAFENPKVLPELVHKLKLLAERLRQKESELSASRGQHRSLRGNFEKAIIAAEKANDRVKKLESILDSTTEETLELRIRSQRLERDVEEKEKDIQSLTVALGKYRDDVGRLEQLIGHLEQDYKARDVLSASVLEVREQKVDELEAHLNAETRGRQAAEQSAIARLTRINELELTLATTQTQAKDVEKALTALQQKLDDSTTSHESETGALNSRVSHLATSLAQAHAEIDKLRTTKLKLEQRVREEVNQGEIAVQTLQDQLLRTLARTSETRKSYFRGAKVRVANWELQSEDLGAGSEDGTGDNSPVTPSSVRFAEFAEVQIDSNSDADEEGEGEEEEEVLKLPSSVKVRRGSYSDMKRAKKTSNSRGYDSGIGMMTPEQSSDAE